MVSRDASASKKQSTPQNTLQSLSWNNDNDYGGASCRLGEYITSCQHILPPFFCNRHKVQEQLQLPGTKCNCQAPSASSAFFAAFSSCAQLDHNLMGCRNKLFFFKSPEWGVGPTWAWHDIREVSVFMKTGEFLLHIFLPDVQVNIFFLLFSWLATKKGELLGILGMGEVTVASSSMVIVCRTNKFTFSKYSTSFMLTLMKNHCNALFRLCVKA